MRRGMDLVLCRYRARHRIISECQLASRRVSTAAIIGAIISHRAKPTLRRARLDSIGDRGLAIGGSSTTGRVVCVLSLSLS